MTTLKMILKTIDVIPMHHQDIPSQALQTLSPQSLFSDLPVGKIRFHLRAKKRLSPFFYAGSAWRGVLGWEMKALICPFEGHACSSCSIQSSCPYFGLFEKQTSLPGIQDAPRGYIIYPQQEDTGHDLSLLVTLIGGCTAYSPVLIKSVVKAAQRGVGREGLRFSVQDVEQCAPDIQSPAQVPPPGQVAWPLKTWIQEKEKAPAEIDLCLPTPLRVRRSGHYLDSLDWSFVLQTLARRLEALHCIFAQGRPLGRETWTSLVQTCSSLCPSVQEQTRGQQEESGQTWLTWRDLKRFSNRQGKKVPMGGLVGRVHLAHCHPWLMSWLQAAQVVHVGKGAAMGLGRMELRESMNA